MFRIGLKFPYNDLIWIKKYGFSRLYLIARYHESRTRVKCESDERLHKDIRFVSRFTGFKYSTAPSRSKKSQGSGTLITLGAITIGTLGILTYAKQDPEIRVTLENWIPGADKAIQIIFQEESNYFDFVLTFFKTLKQIILDLFIKETSKSEPASRPVFKPLIEKKEAPKNENYTEIHVSKEKSEKVNVVVEKLMPPSKIEGPEKLMPQNLIELETYCNETAAKAIAAYHKAMYALQNYNRDIVKVIESTGTISGTVWQRLKEATEKRKEIVQQAEDHAKNALNLLKSMYNLIDESVFEAPTHIKSTAKQNIKKIMDDVYQVKRKYIEELQNGDLAERYWKQIKTAREDFDEELQILFPNINIHDKKLSVSEEVFDLFILYMYHKVNNLQKELEKLRTVSEAKVKAALRTADKDVTQEKLNALICLAVDQERLQLEDKHAKKLLAEHKKLDDEMRRQLKLQSEIHADHLREALLIKEQEMQRILRHVFIEQTDTDSIKYKTQLAAITGRLHALTATLKARMEEEKGASNVQILWSACQVLARAVKIPSPNTMIRPLEPEIKAISKVALKKDFLVHVVIQSIPEEATKRGVFSEDVLRKRFFKVESMAKRLAMVPEEGAALPIYLLSYLQNFLIIKMVNSIPKKKLEDEPIDVNSLNTYDILQRARYWLDRGNFKMTLRYMNLLKGAPRNIARDWMNETRILLETQQVIDTLLAYAGAIGLVYFGTGDSKK